MSVSYCVLIAPCIIQLVWYSIGAPCMVFQVTNGHQVGGTYDRSLIGNPRKVKRLLRKEILFLSFMQTMKILLNFFKNVKGGWPGGVSVIPG